MRSRFFSIHPLFFVMATLLTANVTHALCVRITNPVDNQTVAGTVSVQAGFSRSSSPKNPTFSELDSLFTKYGTRFSPELLKALAWQESGWQQFSSSGEPEGSPNYDPDTHEKVSTDWGIMQINDRDAPINLSKQDLQKIKDDPEFCIKMGVAALENKQKYIDYLKSHKSWPRKVTKYDLAGKSEQDILLKAYNGFQKSWLYADSINKHLQNKPWEAQTQAALLINEKMVSTRRLRLIDPFTYSWDTTLLDDGLQRISARAGTGEKVAEHSIKVNTQNHDAIPSTGFLNIYSKATFRITEDELKTRYQLFAKITLKNVTWQNVSIENQKTRIVGNGWLTHFEADIEADFSGSEMHDYEFTPKKIKAKISGRVLPPDSEVFLSLQQPRNDLVKLGIRRAVDFRTCNEGLLLFGIITHDLHFTNPAAIQTYGTDEIDVCDYIQIAHLTFAGIKYDPTAKVFRISAKYSEDSGLINHKEVEIEGQIPAK